MTKSTQTIVPARRPLHFEFGERVVALKQYLPRGLRSLGVDLFVRYAPIRTIRFLWKELDGYFKLETPKPGDVVIDAGAWTGHFTVIAARIVGRGGRVISIEPQKVMCERLRARLSGMGFQNVTVVEAALFNRASQVAPSETASSGFTVLQAAAPPAGTAGVKLRKLDDIIEELGINKVDFIKMDIEGAELEALAGMSHVLSTTRPFLAIASYHVREGSMTASRVESILTRFGYSARTGHRWHLTTWGSPS